MVDEVEISNVGGPKGVASEATLAALVKAIQSGESGREKVIKLENLARKENTKEIDENSSMLGRSTKALGNYIKGVGKEFFAGSGRLSDFSDAVLGNSNIFTGAISAMAHFVDDNVDMLRSLSSVGASFNGSIFDMRSAAAGAAMNFEDFAELVKQNSVMLSNLGGSVTAGATAFGTFSKNIRTGRVGQELMGMGFTIADINEGLASYLEIQMRSGRQINLNDQKTIKNSEAYLFQLDQLARLTGKQREHMADLMEQQLQDGKIQIMMQNMTAEEQMRFQGTLAAITEKMPTYADAFKDLADGAAQTPLGQILMQNIEGIMPLMNKFAKGQVDELTFFEELQKLAPEFKDLQNLVDPAQLEALRGKGGVAGAIAEAVDGIYEFNQVNAMNIDALREERDRRSVLTEIFGSFEQMIINARTALFDAFYQSPAFEALREFGTTLGNLVKSDGTLEKFKQVVTYMTNVLFGPEGILTRAIKYVNTKFEGFLKDMEDGKTFGDAVRNMFSGMGSDIAAGWKSFWEGPVGKDFKNTLLGYWQSITSAIKTFFADLFLGKEVMTGGDPDSRQLERQGGLIESMMGVFKDLWESPLAKDAVNGFFEFMKDMFGQLIDMISNLMREKLGGVAGSELGSETMKTYEAKLRAGEELTPEEREDLLNTIQSQNRTKIMEEKGSGFLGWRNAANFLGEASGLASDAFNLNQMMYDDEDLLELIDANKANLPQKRIGTLQSTGKTAEPEDVVAQLHQGERVLNPQETQAFNNLNTIQTQLIKKVEELNTSMLKAVGLLEESVNVARATSRNIRGLGTDVMRGVGR